MIRASTLLLVLATACSDDSAPSDEVPPDGGSPTMDAAIADDGGSPVEDGGAVAADAGSDGVDGSVAGGSCPPAGPFGSAVGEIAPDVVLFDCDGNEVRLHDALCDAPVGWVFEYAEWCPPCRSFARDDVENIWQAHQAQGLAAVVVVSADASYDAPTAELCGEVRDRYSLTMPVLFDPTGALQSGLDVATNAVDVLFTEGMRIEWKGRYQADEVDGRISGLLE